jgi:hypothetical protein
MLQGYLEILEAILIYRVITRILSYMICVDDQKDYNALCKRKMSDLSKNLFSSSRVAHWFSSDKKKDE